MLHRRHRVIVAVGCTALLTMLMWSDSPTAWWSSIIEYFLEANQSATSTVLDARPGGDLDIHIVLWFATTLVWWWALRHHQKTMKACLVLLGWASLVETLQPMFTEIRDRQLGDYLGNGIGIGLVVLGLFVRRRYFEGPISPAT